MSIVFTNIAEFERDLIRFIKKTNTAPKLAAKRIAFEVFRGVTEKTPVDTGWAKANWKFTVGKVDTSVLDKAAFKGTRGARSKAQAANADQRGGVQKVVNPYPRYIVSNSTPYIGELEAGRTKQVGKGYMITRTLGTVRQNLNRWLKELS